jgi:hypothetical protein
VRGYGVRLENVTNGRVDSVAVAAVDTTTAWLDSRAGVYVIGGTGNRARYSSFSGIAGMDAIRLSATHLAVLASDTVTGGRNAVRADSSSATTSGLMLSGGSVGFLLTQADTLVSSGDVITGAAQSCVRVAGAGQRDSLKAAQLDNCATGSADSAAITINATAAHFATVNTRFTNMNRRLIRFMSGRALHVTSDTMVTSGVTPGVLDSAVVGAIADTVRVSGTVITDQRRRPALDLAATTNLFVDHNLIARNAVGIRLGATIPPSGPDRWIRNNDVYDHDTAGATGFPVDSLLLKNWWGDARGPVRRFLFATRFDSTAAGDSVALVQDSAGYLSRLTSPSHSGVAVSALRVMRGDGQTADADAALALPLTVRATDAAGRPVSGVAVRFAKDSTFVNGDDLDIDSTGTNDTLVVTTDPSGVAEVRPKFSTGGSHKGQQRRFSVRVVALPTIVVYVRAKENP